MSGNEGESAEAVGVAKAAQYANPPPVKKSDLRAFLKQIRRFRQNSLLAGVYGMGLFIRWFQWLGRLGLRSAC